MLFQLTLFISFFIISFQVAAAPKYSKHRVFGIHYPPFIHVEMNGEAGGIAVELAKDALGRVGMNAQTVRVLPPRRSVEEINRNPRAVLLSSRIYFPESEAKDLIFVEQFKFRVVIFGLKSEIAKLKSIEQISTKKMALLARETFEIELAQKYKAKYFEVDSVESMVRMILSGRVELGVCIPISCEDAIKKIAPEKLEMFDYESFVILNTTGDLIFRKTPENLVLQKELEKVYETIRSEKKIPTY